MQALSRLSQRGIRAIARPLGFRTQHPAARNLAVGTEAQPRGKMLVRPPVTHVHADFGENRLHRYGIEAINLR